VGHALLEVSTTGKKECDVSRVGGLQSGDIALPCLAVINQATLTPGESGLAQALNEQMCHHQHFRARHMLRVQGKFHAAFRIPELNRSLEPIRC
jgi:hypothetical protein